jgi:hypothetical protein
MNTLLKFHHTPTGRTSMKTVEEVIISTGAQTRDSEGRWAFINVHVNDRVSKGEPSYYVQMDRETAARVAKKLQEYLDAKVTQ